MSFTFELHSETVFDSHMHGCARTVLRPCLIHTYRTVLVPCSDRVAMTALKMISRHETVGARSVKYRDTILYVLFSLNWLRNLTLLK